jgi:hypothetical protein
MQLSKLVMPSTAAISRLLLQLCDLQSGLNQKGGPLHMLAHKKLEPLVRLATLIRNRDLEQLARSRSARKEAARLLEELGEQSMRSLTAQDIPGLVELRYASWQYQKRIALNVLYTQRLDNERAAIKKARRSFGRAEVLRKIQETW